MLQYLPSVIGFDMVNDFVLTPLFTIILWLVIMVIIANFGLQQNNQPVKHSRMTCRLQSYVGPKEQRFVINGIILSVPCITHKKFSKVI